MGKIKSAAEIALEKTKHYTADAEDKIENKFGEYIKAAGVLAVSLLNNNTEPEKIREAVDRYPDGAREPALKTILRSFSEGINYGNTPAVIEAIRCLTEDEVLLKACDDVDTLYRDFQSKVKESDQSDDRFAREKLTSEGIRGSAIHSINTDISRQQNISSQLEEEYHVQLSGFCSFLSARA